MPPSLKPRLREGSFLSPSNYDDDASSIHSERSDQDTDSEDDEVLMGARTSADIRAHDRGLLLEEEERDRLIEENRRRQQRRGSGLAAVPGNLKKLFSKSHAELPGVGGGVEMQEVGEKEGKRRRRRERRRSKKERLLEKAAEGEDGELMHELEEGGIKEGSITGDSSETEGSDEADRRGLLGLRDEKAKRKRRWLTWCLIHITIAVGFAILLLIAYKLSRKGKNVLKSQKLLSNGTALFAPTTILISLDGFRADFLQRGITPRLDTFVKEGVSPLYMTPSFPSVTFPNHYTIVTGLYPESHGVVGNTFWDPKLKEEFFYTHPNAMQPKWWGGEPLWVTAENQGIRTAIHMWPGSEAHIAGVEPAFLDTFKAKELLPNKVSRILGLLDRPGVENIAAETVDMRPQLILAYVPNVDAEGHRSGPNSTTIRGTIKDVDDMLDQMFIGLEERNLTHIVNVVVVSDHGMATTDTNRLIQLEDIIDMSLIEHTDGWPLYGLRPKNMSHLQDLYDTLAAEAARSANFDVYLRDKNMPERYHFSNNDRIAPLWLVPKTGWAMVTKKDFNVKEAQKTGAIYHPRGLHGYDHEHPLMRAIFVARGPAFPHAPNSRVDPFQNIEIYNILCDSLGLIPKPNNGTLRLPLKPVGLHTPETALPEPEDPVSSSSSSSSLSSSSTSTKTTKTTKATVAVSATSATSAIASSAATKPTPSADAVISISPIEASSAADPKEKPPAVVGVDEPGKQANNERPTVEDDSTTTKDKGFLQWLKDQVEKMKEWIKGSKEGKEGKEGKEDDKDTSS